MPTTSVPGFIVDQYGRPYALPGTGGSQGNQYRRTDEDDRLRPRPLNHFGDYLDLLSPQRYRELVSECRALATRGQTSSLLEQKADYVAASGFRPTFLGHDAAYGAATLASLADLLKLCNLRGALYDWKTTWRLLVPSLATDGQIYVLLTRWAASGWPAVQILEAHRIGQRDNTQALVGSTDAVTTITDEQGNNPKEIRGAYVGCRISSGHIYNREGTEIAYRVLGSTREEDRDISARDLFRVARPKSYSEGRTPPALAAAILDILALDLAQTCALDVLILDAKLNLIETTPTGKVDPTLQLMQGRGPNATAAGTPTTVEERGTNRIIKTGMTLTPHDATRPSNEYMNFDARVTQRTAPAAGWRAEMLDPSALRGGATRLFQDQINTLVQESFETANYAATRVLRYFTAVHASFGTIPLHAETRLFGIAPPPWVEVDRASARYDLEDVAAGRTAMSILHNRDGTSTEAIYTTRATAYELALAIQKKHPDVPLEIILGDLGLTAVRTGTYPQPGTESPVTAPATS